MLFEISKLTAAHVPAFLAHSLSCTSPHTRSRMFVPTNVDFLRLLLTMTMMMMCLRYAINLVVVFLAAR